VNIVPTRLDGAVFLLWDSFPADVQCDYQRTKEKLKEAFGQKQFLLYFQTCVPAPPCQVNESLEVYADDISMLVVVLCELFLCIEMGTFLSVCGGTYVGTGWNSVQVLMPGANRHRLVTSE